MKIGIGIGIPSGLSGGAFTPSSLSGQVLELDAARNITLNGGNVASITDTTSNGYVFTQATAGLQPAFNATSASFNGKPTIQFNGGQMLHCAGLNISGAKTILAVYRLTVAPGAGTSYSLFTLANTAKSSFAEMLVLNAVGGYQNNTFKHDYQLLAASVGNALTIDTTQKIILNTYNGGTNTSAASYSNSINNSAQSIVASGNLARTVGDRASLGARSDGAGAASVYSQMELAYLSVWNRVLSAGELAQLYTWANDTY